MPMRFVRRLLCAAALAAAGPVLADPPCPRPVAPMPTPAVHPFLTDAEARDLAPGAVDRQVMVECLMMEVSPLAWHKTAAGLPRSREHPNAPELVYDEPGAMRIVRALRAEPGAVIVSRPLMLLADGQNGRFECGQDCPVRDGVKVRLDPSVRVGFVLQTTPEVSADGKGVRLKVEFQRTDPNPALGITRPDGSIHPGPTSSTAQLLAVIPDGRVLVVPTARTNTAQNVLVLKTRITAARLTRKPIPVADLVTPFQYAAGELPPLGQLRPADAPPPGMPPVVSPAGFATPMPPPAACPGTAQNAEALCKLVTNMIRPHSWAGCGGAGSVTYDPRTGSLVVSGQTPEVYAEVAELVDALRKLHERHIGRQVAVEIKVLQVREDFFERVGIECPPAGADGKRVAFLSDAQVRTVLEAAQGDRHTQVLAAPKMTVLDGQRGTLQVCQTEVFQTGLELSATPGGVARKPKLEAVDLGLRLAVTPTISADRRFVRLDLRYESAGLAGGGPAVPVVAGTDGGPPDALFRPQVTVAEICQTLAVPHGRTAAVASPPVCRDGRGECAPPVVAKIPYMNRLFKNPGTEPVAVRQLLLVTPRVIADEPAGCDMCPEPRKLVAAAGGCNEPCTECRAADPRVAELVAAYRKACADGRTEAATALAVQALALDPACFAGK